MNIKDLKNVHFTGIKGVGMTSLGLCFADLGTQVSGSDVEEIFVTDEILARRKIPWKVGFGKSNLKFPLDLLITTGAHGGLVNPEVIAAKRMGIPVMTHAEALAKMAEGKLTIATCGVGGKTTTASMISYVLSNASYHPSFAIGVGNIYPIDTPGRYDQKGKHFVCEADEFAISPGINNNPRFSMLSPKILVVTNIEHDHPDIYPTLADTKEVFKEFFERIPKDGLLVAFTDNSNVWDIVKHLNVNVVTYGFSKRADWIIGDVQVKDSKTVFNLKNKGRLIKDISIRIPGTYNVANATAAFIAGDFVGIKEEKIKEGLENFEGCRRRFEHIGERNGVSIYDDYAHHPKELKAVLAAAKEWFNNRRIAAIFQPHTYSRTKALFYDFSRSFGDADIVVFMDIYASAREKPDLSIDSKKLSLETKKYQSNVYYTSGQKETLSWIKKHVKKGDVLITLGAGDIFHIHKHLFTTNHE